MAKKAGLNLARKYRPSSLEELRGQTQVVRFLTETLAKDRFAPAYLLAGPRGVGKTSAARILAKAAACTAKKNKPCNQCDSCLAIDAGQNMDIREIDGASHTGVDDVRSLIESVAYRPNMSARSVFIIDEVHMLSTAAFNALLKTLEEPPPHALFIFATTELEKIPATILSRVQRLELKRISEQDLKDCLRDIASAEGITASETILSQIASAADGAFRDAQTLMEQIYILSGSQELSEEVADQLLGSIGSDKEIEFLALLSEKNIEECLRRVSEFYERGKDLEKLLARLVQWTRALLLLRNASNFREWRKDYAEEHLLTLEGAFSQWSLDDLDRLFEVLWSGLERIRKSDMPRISFETCVIRACQLPQTQDLKHLLKALENLSTPQAAPVPLRQAPSVATPLPAAPRQPLTKEREKPAKKLEADTEIPPVIWGQVDSLLEAIKKLKPSFFPLLKSASQLEWKDNELLAVYSEGHFALQQLGEPAILKELHSLLKKACGRELSFKTQNSQKKTTTRAEATDFMKDAKRQVLADPAVAKAAALLQGKISSVTIEGVKSS